jgi:uncharacterized protein YecT (DUF1311 family)
MTQVDDLSHLSGPQLRRLLDATRQSGEAEQSYAILQEMAARREGRARPNPSRKPRGRAADEPRTLNLGDAPEVAAEVAETVLPPGAVWHSLDDRASRREPDPPAAEEDLNLSLPPERPPERSPVRPWARPRLPLGLTAGFAAGLAAGVALGWWAHRPPAPVAVAAAFRPPPPAEPPAAASVAAVSPPAPAATPEPASEAPAESPPAASSEPAETAAASPAAAEAAPINALPRTAAVSPAAHTGAEGCAAQPTPADRTICGDASLRRLRRELRKAYAAALAAHADRDTLREHQLAWADARDGVTDSGRLAAVYAQRIRRLNAAAADARRQK